MEQSSKNFKTINLQERTVLLQIFSKLFWIDLKYILFSSFLYTEKNGTLSTFQKLGILNLAPKEGKDLRYLKNWHPITLLILQNYQILTKALAMRLQKSLPSLMNPDQVGYISGRYIGQNIRTIFDIMTYTDDFRFRRIYHLSWF